MKPASSRLWISYLWSKTLIKPFHQLHSAFKQLAIRTSLFRPAIQHLVDPKSLVSAIFLIQNVSIVNYLADYFHPPIANPKRLQQCLKSAVLPTMTEAALKHVIRH